MSKYQKLSFNKRTIVLLNEKGMGRLEGGTGDTATGGVDDGPPLSGALGCPNLPKATKKTLVVANEPYPTICL